MKKITYGIMCVLMLVVFNMFAGCMGLSNSVVYDVAVLTTVTTDIYSQFNDISQIIAKKVSKFDKLDQKTIINISNKFNRIKFDIDEKSINGTDITSITMKFVEYLDIYRTIAMDYMTAKEILERNADKFSPAELARLKLFDRLALDLHAQVVKIEIAVKEDAKKSNIDITGIMSTTAAVLKAIGSIVVLM